MSYMHIGKAIPLMPEDIEKEADDEKLGSTAETDRGTQGKGNDSRTNTDGGQ